MSLLSTKLLLLSMCFLHQQTSSTYQWRCEKSPDNTNARKMPGDNGYSIKINGNPSFYSPGEMYTVTLQGLKTNFGIQKFQGFTLVIEPSDPHKILNKPQDVGTFQLYGAGLTKYSTTCGNAITHTTSHPKSAVSVLWAAPPPGMGCIRFKAMVQEERDIWYADDGELTYELCEELSEAFHFEEDNILTDCCTCNEAKYEITFEGIWSRHTHPRNFPENEWLTHFSDIVGASHSNDYRLWEYGGIATDGLRQLAEWGATTQLERELKRNSQHIRTIIKARGLAYPHVTGKTYAVFRTDNKHHLMSMLSMMGPSPDWIVGVAALELCQRNCSWIKEKRVDLYPWDAGTDNGVSYESPNEPSSPRQPIRRITTTTSNNINSPFFDPEGKPLKPVAKLMIQLQREYEKPCAGGNKPPDFRSGIFNFWESGLHGSSGKSGGSALGNNFMGSALGNEAYTSDLADSSSSITSSSLIDDRSGGGGSGSVAFGRIDPCSMMAWNEWEPCSVTCGMGVRTRRRNFADPTAARGAMCDYSALEETEVCSNPQYPSCDQTPGSIHHTFGSGGGGYHAPEQSQATPTLYGQPDPSHHNVLPNSYGKPYAHPDRTQNTYGQLDLSSSYNQPTQERTPNSYGSPGTYTSRNTYGSLNEGYGSSMDTYSSMVGNYDTDSDSGNPDGCPTSPWSEWSPCSTSCGVGTRTRSRYFLDQTKRCPNKELHQTEKCLASVMSCPSNGNETRPECEVTAWGDWPTCSVTCGKGVRVRRRKYLNPQAAKRSGCDNDLMEVVECSGELEDCHLTAEMAEKICRQPRVVGPCRGSERRWYYDHVTGQCMEMNYGGCRGNANNFLSYQDCMKSCSSVTPGRYGPPIFSLPEEPPSGPSDTDRMFSRNYDPFSRQADGPRYSHFKAETTDTSRDSLYDKPNEDKGSFISGLGYSWNPSHRRTSGKQGGGGHVVRHSDRSFPKTMMLRDAAAGEERVDCEVTPWSPWTRCDATCGSGIMRRLRTIIRHPRNGGNPCPHLEVTRECRAPIACQEECSTWVWGNWSDCSQTCGDLAIQTRRRVKLENSTSTDNSTTTPGRSLNALDTEIAKTVLEKQADTTRFLLSGRNGRRHGKRSVSRRRRKKRSRRRRKGNNGRNRRHPRLPKGCGPSMEVRYCTLPACF
ncbi:unnamed protein product [Cyprideis torosa]|uniref:Spondin-1 n=1 Tax=Cyprideis torosa TaxID=163714 RepID=A0A7R8W398_9CRUS|nr:unnamed protein product [Cyprideis torosa]CAG0879423.1 unnamed protein product [Cyprideis torosa]